MTSTFRRWWPLAAAILAIAPLLATRLHAQDKPKPRELNADIGYTRQISNKVKGTATLAYNIFGRRVFAAGANGLGDQYELPVGTLHLILRADIGDRWQANLGLRNLLNPEYRIEQEAPNGNVELSTYRVGTGISFGLGYRLF